MNRFLQAFGQTFGQTLATAGLGRDRTAATLLLVLFAVGAARPFPAYLPRPGGGVQAASVQPHVRSGGAPAGRGIRVPVDVPPRIQPSPAPLPRQRALVGRGIPAPRAPDLCV